MAGEVSEGHDDKTLMSLMSAMRSLAALIPKAEFESELARKTVDGLNDSEMDAVYEFVREGHRCLSKLSRRSLSNLQKLSAGGRAIAHSKNSSTAVDRKGACPKTRSVYQLFEQFDTDNDGVLSKSEFKLAFKAIVGDQSFSDSQLESLARSSDVNGDGTIDIHEFSVWLYSAQQSKDAGVGATLSGASAGDDAEDLKVKLQVLESELTIKTKAINHLEDAHEADMDAVHDFWKEISKHAILTIDKKVNLKEASWLGNGKYGFVLKARRRADDREVVVKMMGTRWAHLAVGEWKCGHLVGKHPNIIEYEEVMLHADNDSSILKLLEAGYECGKLKARTKRKQFPDRYICLTVELMNRGTVQDWMDRDLLMPSGLFCVMRDVAKALAYMHSNKCTHNDIKTENVLLHEEDGQDVIVKLGDLGLAKMSEDRSADFWQYGMTAFCMITGEKFGARKYSPESADDFVQECRTTIDESGATGKVAESLDLLPGLMSNIFHGTVEMEEVASVPELGPWRFLDSEGMEEGTAPEETVAEAASPEGTRATREGRRASIERHATQKKVDDMGGSTPPASSAFRAFFGLD